MHTNAIVSFLQSELIKAYAPHTIDYAEGWSIFSCNDGMLRIQRLDDPSAAYALAPPDPVFEDDDAAIAFVALKAAQGSAYHAAACALHNTKAGVR